MGELIDKTKGKVKESVGTATGDRRLESEGKADTMKGKIKGAVETAKQRVKDAMHRDPNPNVPRH